MSHLNNHHVDEGDLFLYFGWFRQTEYDINGKLRFVPGAPDLQVIYGYLQVGKACRTWDEIKKVSWHPHADVRCEDLKYNAIYLANDKFLDTELEGYGVLNFSKDLVLTKEGETRSKWQLPACLIDKEISYHNLSNYKDGYFQSAKRGQEFVVDGDYAIMDWVKK